MAKKGKPLTDREKWKNLCDALAEDTLNDNAPEISDAEVKRAREKAKDAVVESHVARIEKKLAKEAQRKKNKHIN
jgi:hypothetical protein